MSAPLTAHAWMVDVSAAVTELGYGIERITPRSIRLSDQHHTITVETVFLSGNTLRALLSSRLAPANDTTAPVRDAEEVIA